MRQLVTKIAAMMLMVFVGSCNEEDIITNIPAANEAVVRFDVPDRSSVNVGAETRTAKNELETKITNVTLFVVEAMAEGEANPGTHAKVLNQYSEFANNKGEISVNVKPMDKPCWVIAVANTSTDVTAKTFNDISKLSEGLTSLYYSESSLGTLYANKLPMSGMKYFDKIENGDTSLELEHICARIEITSTVPEFTVQSVTLLNGANTGDYIAKSPLKEYKNSYVTEYKTTDLSKYPYVYLFENSGGTYYKNYTDIIIGGKYTMSGGNVVDSYIKVKLEYGDPLTADIVRNKNYKVNVKSISKTNIGYKTLENAKKGEYSDAQISIEVGLEALKDLVVGNGDYYMSFSNSEFRAFIPPGTKEYLTAFTMRFEKNSKSNIDMATLKKEIFVSEGSTGITLVKYSGDNTSRWEAATDINIEVHLTNNANGSIIVRIGNLVKEIKVVREDTDANLPTAFHDDNYVHAKFVGDAPNWLKIATKEGTPEELDALYSSDGFTFEFKKNLMASPSAELYLDRSSEKGRTKVYVEQYTVVGRPSLNLSRLSSVEGISYKAQVIITDFSVMTSKANISILDGTIQEGDAYWQTEFSYDDGITWSTKKPEWLDIPTSGVGAHPNTNISVTEQPLISITGESVVQQDILRKTPSIGSEGSPYNLANENGGAENQNTANSYIIKGPGTYKLPLVYGNAIKDGGVNKAAYTSGGVTGDNILETFIDYKGNGITQPEINNAASAILCWEDAPNLVSNVKLDGNYLVFTIAQETITEGNALVAIRDGAGTIIWSWHIWVTNYTSNKDQNVYYDKSFTPEPNNYYTMMNVNLGWTSPYTRYHGESARTVRVRLKQIAGATSFPAEGFVFTQNQGIVESVGSNTFYQWGRKDPMLPADGTADNVERFQSGDLLFNMESGPKTISDAIQNPNTMYYRESVESWFTQLYNNLWSAKYIWILYNSRHIDEHIKTIYDPSPIGYIVPPISCFTGITRNAYGSFNKGRDFYCGPNSTGPIMHFPATGCHYVKDGRVSEVTTGSYNWGATLGSNLKHECFQFTTTSSTSFTLIASSYGMSVRPVREVKVQ